MAAADDTVWISVLPDMSSFASGVTGHLGGSKMAGVFGGAGKKAGGKFAAGFGAAVAVAIGAGVGLYKIGETFSDLRGTIRTETGAMGDELDGFVENAKNVATQVPNSFDEVGEAIGRLQQRLGLTGDDLEDMTEKVLNAGAITGEDLDIDKMADSFKQFGLDTDDMGGSLDYIYQVSASTGMSMNDLMSTLASAAPSASSLGLSFEETAAMAGRLDDAGLDSENMMSRLTRRMTDLAEAGESPRETFDRVTGTIQGMVDEGQDWAALDLAGEAFGTRNAEKFVDAMRDGKFSLDDLIETGGFTSDTINDVAADTETLGDKWQRLKNRIVAAAEPMASAIFDGLTAAMDWILDTAVPAISRGWDWVKDAAATVADWYQTYLAPAFETVADGITTAWGWVADKFEGDGGRISGLFSSIGDLFSAIWDNALKPTFALIAEGWSILWQGVQKVWDVIGEPVLIIIETAWSILKDALSAIWDQIVIIVETAMDVITDIIHIVTAIISGDWGAAWQGIKDLFGHIWDGIKRTVLNIFGFIRKYIDDVLTGIKRIWSIAWTAIKDFFSKKVEQVKSVWATIKRGFSVVWDWVRVNVILRFQNVIASWRDRIRSAIRSVLDKWDTIKRGFRVVWDWVNDHVFDPMRTLITETIPNAFERGKDAIGTAWEKVKDLAKKPVQFIIDTVYNDGIRPLWNKVAGVFGADKLDKFYFADGGYPVGRVRGPGGPTDDRVPAMLSNQEHVLSAREVQGLGGHGGVEKMRAMARAGAIPAFAGGGWLGKVGGWLKEKASNIISGPWGWLKDKFKGLTEGIGSSKFAQMLAGLPGRVIHWAKEKFADLFSSHAAEGMAGPAPPARGGWVRPSRGPVTSEFGSRWGGFHAGIDVAGGGPTYAARGGKVVKTGWNIGPGRTGIGILLSHGGGTFTYYGHNPPGGVKVHAGEMVKAGQRIGTQGSTGHVTGTHVHFEYQPNGAWGAVNPRRLGLFDGGGLLAPWMAAYHSASMSKPDAVLTDSQWSDIHRLATDDGGFSKEDMLAAVREGARLGSSEGVSSGFSGGSRSARSLSRMGGF